jgi:hypothetical protein
MSVFVVRERTERERERERERKYKLMGERMYECVFELSK